MIPGAQASEGIGFFNSMFFLLQGEPGSPGDQGPMGPRVGVLPLTLEEFWPFEEV